MRPTQSKDSESPIARAADALRRGRLVLVIDVSRPERGGVVVAAASRTSDDTVNFFASHARGLTAIALLPDRAERLNLKLQAADPRVRASFSPAPDEAERWLVTVEARHGVSTGISASDRASTIQALARADGRAEDLTTPGHVHPTLADPGGIVFRRGWSEAAVDLVRAAGLEPVATFCQVLTDAGELATHEELERFANAHGLPVVKIADILAHRMATESFVRQLSQATLPTRHGDFLVRAFENLLDRRQHLVLSLGETRSPEPILTRLHSECLTGDVFHSLRCDCGPQLDLALSRVAAEGRGIVIYLRQEGRGIGLLGKIQAYALQDAGRDTVEANVELGLPIDSRDYGLAAQILHTLGVQQVRIMTNNPDKVSTLADYGVGIATREPIEVPPTESNRAYLETKKAKLGHLLEGV
jgi:3,4-dihydroxy 2-butanone 4-phosphate synthase/GTP cyclohydrolase II